MLSRLIIAIILYLQIDRQTLATPSVVANNMVPDNKLSRMEIVDIFTRKKHFWSNGKKIIVYIKPTDSIEHKIFVMNVLNISTYKYKTMLESVTYSGANTPVIEISSDEEMISKLERTPYSIGYVNYGTVYINDSTDLIKITYD
jgi:ABC-type phosphate transport system substrate-binding protein